MSVYHHVPNKGAILDGIVDLVFDEMETAAAGDSEDWRSAIVRRAHATRRVLRRHAWAIGLLESGAPRTGHPASPRPDPRDPARCRVLGRDDRPCLCPPRQLVYGFALQEAARPFGEVAAEPSDARHVPELADRQRYPHLTELAEECVLRPDYDFGDEFELGLDLILGALARSIHSGDLIVT